MNFDKNAHVCPEGIMQQNERRGLIRDFDFPFHGRDFKSVLRLKSQTRSFPLFKG